MVTVEAIDMVGGTDRVDLGTFDSIQLTGRELRDPDGNVLAWLDDGYWRVEGDLRLTLDIVVS